MRSALLLTLATFTTICCVACEPERTCDARISSDDPKLAELGTWLEDKMQSENIPGAAVAIVQGGEVLHGRFIRDESGRVFGFSAGANGGPPAFKAP